MKKETIDFLKDLQHTLRTQTDDGNAQPVYWGIMEDEPIWGVAKDNSHGFCIYDSWNSCDAGKGNDLDSVRSYLTKTYGISPKITDDVYDDWNSDDAEDFAEAVNDWLYKEKDLCDVLSVSYYRNGEKLARDCFFMTKDACLEHIRRYGYNYNNPRSYAMTAYRCPQYKTLLDILSETDWDREVLQDEEASV